MLNEVDVAIITVCLCDYFSVIIIYNCIYFTFNYNMYSYTFGKGWMGRLVCTLLV